MSNVAALLGFPSATPQSHCSMGVLFELCLLRCGRMLFKQFSGIAQVHLSPQLSSCHGRSCLRSVRISETKQALSNIGVPLPPPLSPTSPTEDGLTGAVTTEEAEFSSFTSQPESETQAFVVQHGCATAISLTTKDGLAWEIMKDEACARTDDFPANVSSVSVWSSDDAGAHTEASQPSHKYIS